MIFLLALKWSLKKKGFSRFKTKTNSNFAVKLGEEQPFIFCLFDEYLFSDICTLYYVTIESIEFYWLHKHMKKVRIRQPFISINSCNELSKTQFFRVRVVKMLMTKCLGFCVSKYLFILEFRTKFQYPGIFLFFVIVI